MTFKDLKEFREKALTLYDGVHLFKRYLCLVKNRTFIAYVESKPVVYTISGNVSNFHSITTTDDYFEAFSEILKTGGV